jgi:hypothetical protein
MLIKCLEILQAAVSDAASVENSSSAAALRIDAERLFTAILEGAEALGEQEGA